MTVDNDVRMIDKVMRVGQLYDLYGALLTRRQQDILEMYYFDDWSLAEIADHLGVSRQAVHDNVRRAEDQLEAYESALSLLEQNQVVARTLQEVFRVWTRIEDFVPATDRHEMQQHLDGLTKEFQIAVRRGEERA